MQVSVLIESTKIYMYYLIYIFYYCNVKVHNVFVNVMAQDKEIAEDCLCVHLTMYMQISCIIKYQVVLALFCQCLPAGPFGHMPCYTDPCPHAILNLAI